MSNPANAFWVIEGDRCYWTGHSCDQSSFDTDIQKAVMFHDEGSAWRVKCWLLKAFAVGLRVTCHTFLPQAPIQAPTTVALGGASVISDDDVGTERLVEGAGEVA